MAESIRAEDRELKLKKAAQKQENPQENSKLKGKPQTEEENLIAGKMKSKKITKEDAEKEVARETVKKKTGYDVEALADVAREVLETGDVYANGPVGKAVDSMAKMKGNAVNDMLEKMASDDEVAKGIIKSGMGSKFLNVGKDGLRRGAKTVLREHRETGGAAGMEKMLCEAVNYGQGMSMDEIRALKISPKTLKKNVKELEVEAPKIPDHTKKPARAPEEMKQNKHAKERLAKGM